MKKDNQELAYENGYQTIETTTGRNGYPQELKYAIVGFDTFDEAQEFADNHELELQIFHRHFGWQLWVRDNNRAWDELDIMPFFQDEDGTQVFTIDDAEDYFDEHVKPFLSEMTCIEELEAFIERQKVIIDQFDCIGEDEFLVVRNGKLEDTFDKTVMHFSYDSKEWIIGAI